MKEIDNYENVKWKDLDLKSLPSDILEDYYIFQIPIYEGMTEEQLRMEISSINYIIEHRLDDCQYANINDIDINHSIIMTHWWYSKDIWIRVNGYNSSPTLYTQPIYIFDYIVEDATYSCDEYSHVYKDWFKNRKHAILPPE